MVWLLHLPGWVVELWPWLWALPIPNLVPMAHLGVLQHGALQRSLEYSSFMRTEEQSQRTWVLQGRLMLLCLYGCLTWTWEQVVCVPLRSELKGGMDRNLGWKNETFFQWLCFVWDEYQGCQAFLFGDGFKIQSKATLFCSAQRAVLEPHVRQHAV